MITELKEAISKVEKLKDEDQKRIAKLLEDEIGWDDTIEGSQSQLNNLAQEALHEYTVGKTKEELKEKLHLIIEKTDNKILLEDLISEAKSRTNTSNQHEAEGLSKDDYDELISLVNELPEKDTVSYDELKSSLSRWFTK